MRNSVMVLALLCTAACSQNRNAGLHTVDGNVPLYVDATQSGAAQRSLSPALIDQAKTMANLGDALRLLGPAYVSRNDPAHIYRWHFSDGTTLTPWPQGGERLSDGVSVYPSPNCRMPAYACQDLVMGRNNKPPEEELSPEEREHALYRQYSPQPFVPAQPQPAPNPNKPSAGELFEQGLANTAVQTTSSIAQGLTRSSIGFR